MVVGWNCSEFEASECKICLPYALVSSDSPPHPKRKPSEYEPAISDSRD